MMTRRLSALLLSCTLASLALPQFALSSEPLIQVGGGIEANSQNSDVDVLLHVSVGARVQKLVIAHIHGDLALNQATGEVPYFKVEFKPVTQLLSGDINSEGMLHGAAVSALRVDAQKDLRLDQKFDLRISAIEVRGGVVTPGSVGVYAEIALSVLGYGMFSRASSDEVIHALQVGSASAEAGVIARLTQEFKIQFAFGGSADLSLGRPGASGSIARSEQEAFAELSVKALDFMKFFARASLHGVTDTAHYEQFMLGAVVIF